MGYIYGNTIKKSGGNPWRTFLTASVSSTNDTTTFSGSMGMNPYDGWIKSGKRVYSLAGTGQTTVSKTQSDVKLASGSHTVQKSATWSWARGTTAQTKTITAKTVYTGSKQDGTSTATYTVTVPALPYFTLTFNANGGSSTSTRSVQYKSIATSFPSVSRTGYTFNGWYTASSGGSRVTSITMPASNYTLYAQWTIITYYVYFNAQGGTAPATQSKTYGSSITLNSPTRSGWTFKGWATSSNTSTVSYAPGATYSANATTTLYAVWQKNVTLSFDANQGTGAPENQSATIVNPTATSATITISNTVPTRTNYKFTGWQLGSDTYTPGSNITISDNTTLTAVWQLDYIPPQYVGVPTAYRVSYDSDKQAYVFDDTGTYGYLEFAWTDGSMGGEPITTETATAKYQEHGASTWTNIAGTVSNNKFTAVFGGGNLSTDKQYDIVVSVQNEGHEANPNTTYISTVAFTIDINEDGTAIGFFAPAGSSGINSAKQIKTSFKSSIAMGSYGSAQTTVPNFIDEVRMSSGCCGSVSIGTAYTKNGVTINAGWYNFMYMPHRSGGVNGSASGDNCNYGNCFLFGMNNTYGRFIIRVASASIQEVAQIYTSIERYTRSNAGTLDWSSQADGNAKVIMKSALAFWNGAYNGTGSNLKYSANGEIIGTNTGLGKTTWTPTRGSSYSNYGGCYYEKYGRTVHVHLGVSGLTASTSATVFTLPSGYRPSSPIYAYGTGGAWNTLCYVAIGTGGAIDVRSQGAYCGADITFMT